MRELLPWLEWLKLLTLDFLFPPTCIGCQAADAWLCPNCEASVFLFRHAWCPRCGASMKTDHACEGSWPFASITVCASYADPVVRKLVTLFKYRSAHCLSSVWKRALFHFREERRMPWPWAGLPTLIVTSVPGDPGRMRERGMDHAAMLADMVRDTLVPWAERVTLLRRTKSVGPNAILPPDVVRQANVKGLFQVLQPIHQPVLLVDDVLTTGATLNESARMLLAAGAPCVHVFSFARGS